MFPVKVRIPARQMFWLAGLLIFVSLFEGHALLAQTGSVPVSGGTIKGLVIVIPVHDNIDSGLSFFIQRMIRRAEREEAKAIILEINSNGGLVTAAQEMKDALLRAKVMTVAYVKGRALSAAALVAISCQKIFMESGSEMGAATPYKLMGDSVQAAEAKFVSAFRAEFESAAEARKRPKALAGAMVDKDHDTIPGIVKRGEILTLTSEVALNSGFCDFIVGSTDQALRRLNIEAAPLEKVEPSSGEVLARWLTDPNISVVLFTLGFWLIILEFLVFGWGILGWVGLLCIGLFFGGHLFAYLAGLEAVILFFLGAFLLILEAFVIPGFGITGVAGIFAVMMSIVIVFGGIYTAVYAVSKIFAISIVMIVLIYNLAPRLKLFDRFVLKQQLSTAEGFVAVDVNAYDALLNLEGITLSPCRPSGYVRIGKEKYEVVSEGEFIERNQRIIVTAVEGTKIVVRTLNG